MPDVHFLGEVGARVIDNDIVSGSFTGHWVCATAELLADKRAAQMEVNKARASDFDAFGNALEVQLVDNLLRQRSRVGPQSLGCRHRSVRLIISKLWSRT